MKQTNIEKLIEWMDKEIKSEDIKYPTFIAVYNKAKQLQREEPKDLVSKEDALGFPLWVHKSYSPIYPECNFWELDAYCENKKYTTEELFNLYINQKK